MSIRSHQFPFPRGTMEGKAAECQAEASGPHEQLLESSICGFLICCRLMIRAGILSYTWCCLEAPWDSRLFPLPLQFPLTFNY